MRLGSVLPTTKFGDYLIEHNNLGERRFDAWLFHPGMLFSSTDRWWGNGGNRVHPHEGLDFCLYRDKDGHDYTLDDSIKVPLMYDGEVVHIIDDFIGQSVFVIHDTGDGKGHQLLSVYAHVEPYDGFGKGKTFQGGDVIATIKDTNGNKVGIMPHLHLSLAWVPRFLLYDQFNWKTIRDPAIVTLLNPLEVMDCTYTVLKDGQMM